jgi:hypothetical protein
MKRWMIVSPTALGLATVVAAESLVDFRQPPARHHREWRILTGLCTCNWPRGIRALIPFHRKLDLTEWKPDQQRK